MKQLPHVGFLDISRTATLTHNVWFAHCYEATLVNKKMQKTEIKISNQKDTL